MQNKSLFYLLLISLFIVFTAVYLYQSPQILIAAPLNPAHSFGTIPPPTVCDINPWQRTSSMIAPRTNLVTIQAGEYIYALGGFNTEETLGNPNSAGILDSTEYASINADGTLGSWNVITSTMITARASFAGVVMGNYIYVLGGFNGSNYLSSVERAEIKADSRECQIKCVNRLP